MRQASLTDVAGLAGVSGVALDSTLFGPPSMLYGIEHAAREAGYALSPTH